MSINGASQLAFTRVQHRDNGSLRRHAAKIFADTDTDARDSVLLSPYILQHVDVITMINDSHSLPPQENASRRLVVRSIFH